MKNRMPQNPKPTLGGAKEDMTFVQRKLAMAEETLRKYPVPEAILQSRH